MRIGIDARILQTGLRNRGIGTYTCNLTKSLIALNTEHQFVFYVFKGKSIPDGLESFDLVKLRRHTRLNLVWQQFTEFRGNIDIFHSSVCLGPTREAILPYFQPKPTVATVYDLSLMHLDDPWSEYFSKTRDYRIQLHSIRRANKIVAISEYVKKDIIDNLHVDGDKIKVIPAGVATGVFRRIEDKSWLEFVKKKHNIEGRFLLAVGELPNKNIGIVFRSLRRLKNDILLVVVGKEENCREIHLVRDLGLERRVIFTGEIPQDELVALYNLAGVLVFPSLAEGFGLPPLEAMACGCPVIASNRSAIPEVVGDGGVILSPYDIEGMVFKIKRILDDVEFRKKLIERGSKQARRFSWSKCAEETLQVYEEIA